MTVIDTSGWLEYLTDGPLATQYEKYLAKPETVITPSITLSEVYRNVNKAKGAEVALSVVAQMEKTRVIPLDATSLLGHLHAFGRFPLPGKER